MPQSTVYPHRARVAALKRHHGPDHPETQAAEQALAAAKREKQEDRDFVRALVAAAPPLTDEQRAKLRALLSPGAAAG